MKFSDVLKEAFAVSWRYRWFWIAGFLIYPQLVGGYPMNLSYQPGQEFPLREYLMFIAIAMGAGVFVLLSSSIIQPALIIATASTRAGTPLRAGDALRAGYEFAVRCLMLALLWFGCCLLLVIMLGVPVVIAFINSVILGVVVALFFIPVLLVAFLLLHIVMNHSYRNIVLLNMNVGNAIAMAFEQFKRSKLASIGLALTATLIPLIAVAPLSFAASMLQIVVLFASGESISTKIAFFALMTLLSIPIVGYFGAFSSVLWTIAHQEWFGDGTKEPVARF